MGDELASNFIYDFIDEDLKNGVYDHVQTRFPPEPNGYLHVGHVKAITIDFSAAEKYHGVCNLRLDDTNPSKEDVDYVNAIIEDIHWLGFTPNKILYGSDYFDVCYQSAVKLIKKGKAYVCDLSADEIRQYRGTLEEPGKESPYRNRSVEENLELFERMRKGEFENGQKTLRAKIDMNSGNINMRDPVIYRILKVTHHRTGDKWCIYPMYDFNHPISDAAEGVTHSLCTLEFEDHRPLYDWVLREIEWPNPPRQIEFSRLNLNYTLTSKRRCLALVENGIVNGWDDPRMTTIAGMRRRGYPASALRKFVELAGVSKTNSVIDLALLEHCVRDELYSNAGRTMAVLEPLKLTIENYPEGQSEMFSEPANPEKSELGLQQFSFSKHLFIEKSDFMENPPKGYFRLSPGTEVRLKSAYLVTCLGTVKNNQGEVIEVICRCDPESRGGNAPDGRKVKGTIHWIDQKSCMDAEVRLYDRLFTVENPSEAMKESGTFDCVNPDSLKIIEHAKVSPALKQNAAETDYQFMRLGYFTKDRDSSDEKLVFNRVLSLKDSWAKKQ